MFVHNIDNFEIEVVRSLCFSVLDRGDGDVYYCYYCYSD